MNEIVTKLVQHVPLFFKMRVGCKKQVKRESLTIIGKLEIMLWTAAIVTIAVTGFSKLPRDVWCSYSLSHLTSPCWCCTAQRSCSASTHRIPYCLVVWSTMVSCFRSRSIVPVHAVCQICLLLGCILFHTDHFGLGPLINHSIMATDSILGYLRHPLI